MNDFTAITHQDALHKRAITLVAGHQTVSHRAILCHTTAHHNNTPTSEVIN